MNQADLKLIKMLTDHYWLKHDSVVNKIEFAGRTFFNKYERIDKMMTSQIMNQHFNGEIEIAHSLINKNNQVENIVIDYNGRDPERFYHKAQLMLREEGYINFTAYTTKTDGHLHLYIHKGHTTLQEAYQLGKKISIMLAQKQPKQWRMFPNQDMPLEYQILSLPREVYAKERGASWSKHM